MPGRPLVVIFLVVLCLALWLMARGWHDSLLDRPIRTARRRPPS